jgi:Mrp family chromosome partitioning ATPase
MAKYADGFLFVVRHQVTETPAIEDAMTQLDMAGAKILGFIYNDVVEEPGRYSRHGSNYKRYYKN